MKLRITVRSLMVTFLFAALISMGQKASAYTPGACRMDGEKLCPGITNDKELIPCLKQHETELSTDCKVNLAEARHMVREAKDACQSDIEKYCAGVETGKGRIRKCLKAHESELSSTCQAQIAATRKKYGITASSATPAAPATENK